MSKVSKNIKRFRTLSGITQEELAAKVHVTRQTVSSWETGRTQPDLQIIQSLAEVFEVEPEEMIYGKRKNTAEEKEKQLFGNTLITVLSVLGCLLIGAGVVMIFIKWWQDFPALLKLFTCFIPALAGQGFGIYTYIKKKESQPWCEGASVLWLLGTGVTTSIVMSQIDYVTVSSGFVLYSFAAVAFALMLIFRTLFPLSVVHVTSLLGYMELYGEMPYSYYSLDNTVNDLIEFLVLIVFQLVFTVAVFAVTDRLCKKEDNIIRYRFAEWMNFIALAVFFCMTFGWAGFGDLFVSLIILAAVICFIIGDKNNSFTSPYKLFGTLGSAGGLCFLAIITALDSYADTGSCVAVIIGGLSPFVFLCRKNTKPDNVYIRYYTVICAVALLVFNGLSLLFALQREHGNLISFEFVSTAEDVLLTLNFVICLTGLILFVIYGAKERKLLYLNLGFILSCVSVVAKLYLLELGLIVTGVMLIVCGAALLFVNLKFSRLREKEKLASLNSGEGEEQ